MSAAQAILTALLQALPQLWTLIQSELSGGTPSTDAQVQAIFAQFGVEEATVTALIAQLQSEGK